MSRAPTWAGTSLEVGVATLVLTSLVAVANALPLPQVTPGLTATAALVFDGVTVVDVERGQLRPGQRVVIVGTHIQAMGGQRTVAMPAGARIIDARGQYLIPGLWDMHIHLQAEADEPLYLAAGVTGFRDAGTALPLDVLRRRQREILAGTRAGPPRQVLSGRAINENNDACGGDSFAACVADTAAARHLVDSLAAAGADMLKPRDVSQAVYRVVAAEARRLGLPFGGHAQGGHTAAWEHILLGATHVRDGISVLDASELGARLVDHEWGGVDCRVRPARKWGRFFAGPDSTSLPAEVRAAWKQVMLHSESSLARCSAAARRFRHNDTWFVPTLREEFAFRGAAADAVFARWSARSGAREVGASLYDNWLRKPTTGKMLDAPPPDSVLSLAEQVDLPLVAGTDGVGGFQDAFAIHAELGSMVAEGLSARHTLQSATLNPAKLLHATDSLGTVAVGKLADLVLLDANPLEDITNTTQIRAVVANGRYFDRAALEALIGAADPAGSTAPAP